MDKRRLLLDQNQLPDQSKAVKFVQHTKRMVTPVAFPTDVVIADIGSDVFLPADLAIGKAYEFEFSFSSYAENTMNYVDIRFYFFNLTYHCRLLATSDFGRITKFKFLLKMISGADSARLFEVTCLEFSDSLSSGFTGNTEINVGSNQPNKTSTININSGTHHINVSVDAADETFDVTYVKCEELVAADSSSGNNLISEGTFTPILSTAGLTYNTVNAFGYYLKVGKMVTINIVIQIGSTTGTATGSMLITGIPFIGPEDINFGLHINQLSGSSWSLADIEKKRAVLSSNPFHILFHDVNSTTVPFGPSFTSGVIFLSGTYASA